MQNFAYLGVLLFSLGGLTFLDYRQRLAWFWDAKKTGLILALNLVFFLVWDIANIAAGIIATNPDWVTGVYVVTPNLPLEEFLFLTLLGYQTLLLWKWRQRCSRTSA